MTAMVTPIGVQDPELGLIGIPAFSGEISHYLGEVILIHREPHLFAICLKTSTFH